MGSPDLGALFGDKRIHVMHKPGDLDSISRRLEALENRPVIATYTPGTSRPKGAVGLQARGTPHAQPGGTTLQPGSGLVSHLIVCPWLDCPSPTSTN